MIRINYADWNGRDEEGRLILNTLGALRELEVVRDLLRDGLRVLICEQDEFEVEATLVFDLGWRAVPAMATLRYYESAGG